VVKTDNEWLRIPPPSAEEEDEGNGDDGHGGVEDEGVQ
jgi:hypothetical protein